MRARIGIVLATLVTVAAVGLGAGATSAFACSPYSSATVNYHCYSELFASGSATDNYGMGATFNVSCVYLSSESLVNGYFPTMQDEEWDSALYDPNTWVESGLQFGTGGAGNTDIFSDAFINGVPQPIYYDPSYNWLPDTNYVDQIEEYWSNAEYWLADIEGQAASDYDWSQGSYQTLGEGFEGGLELAVGNYTAGNPGTYVGQWGGDNATISSPFYYASIGGGTQINTWRPTGSNPTWQLVATDKGGANAWQMP